MNQICADCGRTIASNELPETFDNKTYCPDCFAGIRRAAHRTNMPYAKKHRSNGTGIVICSIMATLGAIGLIVGLWLKGAASDYGSNYASMGSTAQGLVYLGALLLGAGTVGFAAFRLAK